MSGVTETVEFVKKCDCFFISTLDENEQPRVRPFGLIFEADGKVIIGMGSFKDVYKQIKAHPRTEICAFHKESGKWIRLSGKAVEDNKPEYVEKGFEMFPNLRDLYNEKTGNKMAFFYLDELHSTISSFTDKPVVLV